MPEVLQSVPLPLLLGALAWICERRSGVTEFSIGEEIGRAPVTIGLQGLLEFPFRAGDRAASVQSAIFARGRAFGQGSAEPGIDDQHHNVRGTRKLDGILKVTRREHRLVFPEICLDPKKSRIVACKLLHDEMRPQPLLLNIARRGDEDAKTLAHLVISESENRRLRYPDGRRQVNFFLSDRSL